VIKCTTCGAGLGANDLQCPYCGQQTLLGVQQAQYQKQHELHAQAQQAQQQQWQQHQQQLEAKQSLSRTSQLALFWSLGGLLICCALIPSAIGLTFALRARKMAAKYGLVLPGSATLGLVLSVLGLALGVSTISWMIYDARQRDARIQAIDAALGQSALSPTLTASTACMLAERRLLQEGYNGNKSFDEFECTGKLEQQADRAILHTLRFKVSGDRHVTAACLERGSRWAVSDFRAATDCGKPAGSVATSSTTSAVSTSSTSGTSSAGSSK
jgi:hypothetical protein